MNDKDEREVLERLQPRYRITASASFRERVMSAIRVESVQREIRPGWLKWSWPRWASVAAAAALVLLLVPVLTLRQGSHQPNGVTLLAQSVEALSQITSVHITGQIRSVAGDNFELIGLDYDFVPVEIWREYGNPPRWRIEKPGRLVSMDGQRSLLYIGKTNSAIYGSAQAGFVQWLQPMLDPVTILGNELADARRGVAEAVVTDNSGVTTAVIRRKARGNFENDWARNSSVAESDHATVYHFDSATRRLQGVQVVVTANGRDVVVAEFTGFRYNEAFPDAMFAPQLPADVIWLKNPGNQPGSVTFNGPRDVAAYFFDALSRKDWDAVLNVNAASRVSEPVKAAFGGVQVISLGEPFQSGNYPGWFVPYEVRLRNGVARSYKLAVRNDNAAHRWFVDGGY